jgi:hypothetical protein
MTRGSLSYIECDVCGHTRERSAASTDLVSSEAARRGWSIKEDRDDGRDVCADCAVREAEA